MTSPFCALAADYDARWDGSISGGLQRHAVWTELKTLFRVGDRVLDLGCGTGTDALFLEARGVHVHAIDASIEMVRTARARGVAAEQKPIESLSEVRTIYDGALSNFGALNCVADLVPVATNLAAIVKPGGHALVCVMSRFCWRETLTGLMH